MRSEFSFLFPKPERKPRKPSKKAIREGATVVLTIDGNTYTVEKRDTRYKNAWFLVGVPTSFSRDVLKVV